MFWLYGEIGWAGASGVAEHELFQAFEGAESVFPGGVVAAIGFPVPAQIQQFTAGLLLHGVLRVGDGGQALARETIRGHRNRARSAVLASHADASDRFNWASRAGRRNQKCPSRRCP